MSQRDSIANKQGKRALGGDGKVYLSHVANDNIERSQPESQINVAWIPAAKAAVD